MIVECLLGDRVLEVIDDLARLRITVFRDWPYLYDGDLEYERRYLTKFASSPGAVVVTVRNRDQLVGASTASPLADHFDEFREPFENAGLQLEDFFYFGESVLLKPFRGQGLGVRFFDEREQAARQQGFAKTVFCGVVRPADHPARPHDYLPLDTFWRKRGYSPLPGVVATFAWKDLGELVETLKPMQFWMKELS